MFGHGTEERVTETNNNYKLVIQYLISHLFPPKEPQTQKRYLLHGLYNPHETNICEFIYEINDIIEYLEQLPPFGSGHGLTVYNILKLVELSLTREWKK